MITNYEMSKSPDYAGQIPPIAEKEKRGKRVKIPPSEIYVQEIQSGNLGNNTGGNHPAGRCGNVYYHKGQITLIHTAVNSATSEPISDRLHSK